MRDSSSEDDSTDDEMDSDYDPNDDHDDYSSNEDNQIEESKMEPFSDRSKPHREPKYIVFHGPAAIFTVNMPFLFISSG